MTEQEEFTKLVFKGWTVKQLQDHFNLSRSAIYARKTKWDLIGKTPNFRKPYNDTNKLCTICNIVKSIDEFHTNGTSAKGTTVYKVGCKSCLRLLRYDRYREKIVSILSDLSLEYKCKCCGYNKNTAALVFHHRNPETKLFSIGENKDRSVDALKAEISKCDILCQNCHMEEHHPHLTK